MNATTAPVDHDTEIVESWLPQYIGLHGFAGSGKDAVAKILADYGYERVAFGDKVREALYVLNPVIIHDDYGPQRVQDL
ncbi:hypothetical protein ACFW9W_39100, partial [Streptomyces sp. NPDC059468]